VKLSRNRWVVLLTVLALLTLGGGAMAQETEEEEHDTVFNFGYDSENQVFVWGTSSTEQDTLNCNQTSTGVFGGSYDTTYVVDTEGLVQVDGLNHEGGDPVFFVPNEGEGDEAYSSDGDCGLAGGSVAGPEGQVNHGMFLRLFNSLYDGEGGRGCIIRYIAQSDLGKGDQQVKVEDVDPAAEPVVTGDSGTLVIESALAACEKPKGDDEDEDSGERRGPPEGKGPPEWAGQPGGPGGPPGHDD
jgi:hypothetical protein